MSSAVTTDSKIPNPGSSEDPEPYKVKVRVDNLGRTDASNIRMVFYTKIDGDWIEKGSDTSTTIPGSETSSGYEIFEFSYTPESTGTISHRVELEGNGVEAQYAELRFKVVVDDFSVGAKTPLQFSDGEAVLGFVGVPEASGDGGGLIFTTKNGELHARTLTSKFDTPGNTMIEENWAGEFSFVLRDDNRVHLAWTKRFTDQQGYTMTDIGMASIGMLGDLSSKSSHMTPLKQSEGSYWGFDMSVNGDEIVLAGIIVIF